MIRTNQRGSRTSFWLGGLTVCWLALSLANVGQELPEEKLPQLLKRFPNADLNKDGKLTRDDLLQFRGKTQVPAPAPAATETALAANNGIAAGKVDIRVTTDKPVPINPKIYGINCAEMFIFDLVQKPEHLAALGELQFNTYLFPGGSS